MCVALALIAGSMRIIVGVVGTGNFLEARDRRRKLTIPHIEEVSSMSEMALHEKGENIVRNPPAASEASERTPIR